MFILKFMAKYMTKIKGHVQLQNDKAEKTTSIINMSAIRVDDFLQMFWHSSQSLERLWSDLVPCLLKSNEIVVLVRDAILNHVVIQYRPQILKRIQVWTLRRPLEWF